MPGIEFAQNLMGRMAESGKSLFLLEAKPGIADQAAEKLKVRYPGLQIAGTHDGYFKEDGPVLTQIRGQRCGRSVCLPGSAKAGEMDAA